MTESTRRSGRPRGTGGTTIRFVPPTGEGRDSRRSGTLFIGKKLWQDLGEPGRVKVTLASRGDQVVISPLPPNSKEGYAVSVPDAGQPRIRLGAESARRLRLEAGTWEGQLVRGTIQF